MTVFGDKTQLIAFICWLKYVCILFKQYRNINVYRKKKVHHEPQTNVDIPLYLLCFVSTWYLFRFRINFQVPLEVPWCCPELLQFQLRSFHEPSCLSSPLMFPYRSSKKHCLIGIYFFSISSIEGIAFFMTTILWDLFKYVSFP